MPPSRPTALFRPRTGWLALAGLALLAACGGGESTQPPGASSVPSGTPVAADLPAECSSDYVFTPIDGHVPIIIPQEIAVGQARLTLALEKDGKLLNNGDVSLRLEACVAGVAPVEAAAPWQGLHAEEGAGHTHDGQPEESTEATGVYSATVALPVPGRWIAQVNIAAPAESSRTFFEVRPSATTPAVGSPAPAIDTPVLAPGGNLKQISSADPPHPDLVSTSLKDAIAQKRPVLLILATPAFCASRVCGPQFEEMLTLIPAYKDRVTFIQVEPYLLDAEGQPIAEASGTWQIAPIVSAYGLPDEPWPFLIDKNGNVAAKFEGIANAHEVGAALDAMLGS